MTDESWDAKRTQEIVVAYNAALDLRNAELAAYWARLNIQFALNFGMIGGFLLSSDDLFVAQHRAAICVVGIVLCMIWIAFICQGKYLLHARDGFVRLWEEMLLSKHDSKTRPFSGLEMKIETKGGIWSNMTLLTCLCPGLCIGIWLFLFVSS